MTFLTIFIWLNSWFLKSCKHLKTHYFLPHSIGIPLDPDHLKQPPPPPLTTFHRYSTQPRSPIATPPPTTTINNSWVQTLQVGDYYFRIKFSQFYNVNLGSWTCYRDITKCLANWHSVVNIAYKAHHERRVACAKPTLTSQLISTMWKINQCVH